MTAQQYTYRPRRVELALERAMSHNEAADTIEQGDQAATDQLIKWKGRLEEWRKTRTGSLIG